MNTPLTELELVVDGTSELAVRDADRTQLLETLKPIAERIPDHLAYAKDVVVTNSAQAKSAAGMRDLMLSDVSLAEHTIREAGGGLIDKLFKMHRALTGVIGRFKVVDDAARTVKQKITAWQQDEERKAEEERQRLQAKLDEEARRERERLLKESEKLKTPELKEHRIEQANAVVATQVHVPAPAPVVRAMKRWFVKSVDPVAFVKAAANDNSLLGYITIDQTKLARAKAANSMIEIPGVVFEQRLV